MSVSIQTIITCDGPLPGKPDIGSFYSPDRDDSKYCEGNDWSADQCEDTASEQRLGARERGWVNRGSKDYCPQCWAAMKAALAKGTNQKGS